jgi:D-proline reductase (dithiol) PrdB
VPNCPVCHQSVSLAARSLEAAGISTVITGCVFDIAKNAGAPRFLFNDYPLSNSASKPNDIDFQKKDFIYGP